MSRIAPLILAFLGVCAAAPYARAASEPPADDAARLAAYLPIARGAWPGSPCAGREVVHLAADAALTAEAPAIAGAGGALEGMATPETCEAWIASGLDARTFCTVLVHELGHLAGREHTTVPGDVMNGSGDIDYAPCDRATAPPSSEMLDDALRSMLPAPRAAWKITCGPRRGSERRCLARRGTRVRRYDVTQTATSLTVTRDDVWVVD